MPRLLIALATALAISAPAGLSFAAGTTEETPAYIKDYQQGVRAVKAEEYRKAISLLLSVIEARPRSPDALNYLGYSYRKTGDYARAVTYYKKALSLDPDHRGANEYLGQAYIELGNLKAAQERLDALESICGIDCDEYNTLKIALDAAIARNAKQG